MSGSSKLLPFLTDSTAQNRPLWSKTEIKGRIRQVLARRIRHIIKPLDQSLKDRFSIAPLLLLFLLLSPTRSQATFSQFRENSATNEASETHVERNGKGNELSTEDPEKCVLIYVRVSTDEQEKNGRSIDSQIEELVSIVDSEPEIELYQNPIRDEGETGTDFDREGIQQVARLAQKSEVTHLMVDTIDRIGRSVAETLMFVHELRERFDVNLLTRRRELDVRKPTDRMQVTMLATMADFGTLNRARSSLRSSADNFIKNRQWRSWYQNIPFGYEEKRKDESDEKVWLQRVEKLEPVIKDIYVEFINTESYSKTVEKINSRYKDTLRQYDDLDGDSLSWRQIKAILTRPVYWGEPTIPVTNFEHYEPYPSVDDPQLQFVDEDTSKRAQEICVQINEKYSTDEDLTIEPNDYPEEFSPYIIEATSPLVQLACPDCSSDLIANGHQSKLHGSLGSRLYKCTNENCGYERRWPRESESEMMEMLSELDEFHSLL